MCEKWLESRNIVVNTDECYLGIVWYFLLADTITTIRSLEETEKGQTRVKRLGKHEFLG